MKFGVNRCKNQAHKKQNTSNTQAIIFEVPESSEKLFAMLAVCSERQIEHRQSFDARYVRYPRYA